MEIAGKDFWSCAYAEMDWLNVKRRILHCWFQVEEMMTDTLRLVFLFFFFGVCIFNYKSGLRGVRSLTFFYKNFSSLLDRCQWYQTLPFLLCCHLSLLAQVNETSFTHSHNTKHKEREREHWQARAEREERTATKKNGQTKTRRDSVHSSSMTG